MKTVSSFKLGLLFIALCAGAGLNAQDQKTILYTPNQISSFEIATLGTPQITANEYRLYQINVESLRNQLTGIAQREDGSKGFTALISFPHPDGSLHQYQALGNRTLSAELGAGFPEIKTYDAADTEGRKVKWDITPKGLHVMIFQPGESTIFIDPIIDGNDQYYIVYYKKDFTTDKLMSCEFDSDDTNLNPKPDPDSGTTKMFGTCDLRTYRLALAATGEYTAFHGGTVLLAQSAQATTMNRVNGVYERDMAITMTIIPNNNLIIYTNGGTDPYTNGTPGSMITQNQTNCDAVIGSANYDIGHVFGTNSGGLAGLGVVCSNGNKARGVTGSAAPIGDPFDIDYVAHEMGHQFGANHTQNNPCNSVAATRVEPGSASTIMGYAGICVPNVQSNSDDHFHGINLGEIGIEILSAGHTCEQITPLSNNAPTITGTNGNISIPANTPFSLTAYASDADGDPLLYCWEQMNNQASTQPPVATSTGGPNFRSNSPVLDSTRYFPNLPDLTAGISPTWEVIPSVSRTMNFRVTVRDQSLNVPGCNDHEDVTVTFVASAGPFVVLYPSTTGIVWTALTSETVTWSVANTNLAPINCATVDIFLSTDGGLTYPTLLASDVPNDGSQIVTVPSIATTTARVMVISSNGTFFDISNNNFEIFVPVCVAPDVPTVGGTTSICNGQSTTLTITGGNLNDATNWQWYTASCGGTSVGSGTTINVTPTSTTSYFVRGEGGCVIPGSCLEVEVQVNPLYNLNEAASICQGQTYTYPDGTTSTVSESHTSTLATMSGCDSIIVTDLTVLPSYNLNESAAICNGDTYTFPDGATGTVSQSHTSILATMSGCDSIIVTDLIVLPSYNLNESANICNGDTYTFPDGTTGTVSQSNTSTLATVAGCDSIILTDLTVLPSYNLNESADICNGDTYTFPDGTTGTVSQSHTSTLATVSGCDSIIVTDLTVLPSYNLNESANICNGDTYTFPDGTTGTVSQSHTSAFIAVSGCDSIIVTDLTVLPSYNLNESAAICNGDPYTFPDGTTVTVSQSHTSTLATMSGCDSIIVTDLTVLPSYNLNESTVICDGDTYTFPDGTTGTTAQVQTSVLADVNGCDSTIVTTLTVTTVDVTVNFLTPGLEANLAGATYQWIDCDNGNTPIAGETNQLFIPGLNTGNYAVIITQGGCPDTSACYLINQTGLNELNNFNVNIYPNPSSQLVNINWEGEVSKIELTDVRGRILTVIDAQGINAVEIDVSLYAQGVYFIHLYTESGKIVRELIRE